MLRGKTAGANDTLCLESDDFQLGAFIFFLSEHL